MALSQGAAAIIPSVLMSPMLPSGRGWGWPGEVLNDDEVDPLHLPRLLPALLLGSLVAAAALVPMMHSVWGRAPGGQAAAVKGVKWVTPPVSSTFTAVGMLAGGWGQSACLASPEQNISSVSRHQLVLLASLTLLAPLTSLTPRAPLTPNPSYPSCTQPPCAVCALCWSAPRWPSFCMSWPLNNDSWFWHIGWCS